MDAVKPDHEKSDNELLMENLCKDKSMFIKNIAAARVSKISAERAIGNYKRLLNETMVDIKELERKGIKTVEVEEIDRPDQQAPQAVVPETPS